MFKRQDLTASEQATAIIYQMIAIRLKHVHIHSGQIKFLQLYQPFISFIKVLAFSGTDNICSRPVKLLAFLLSEMICLTYLSVIIHILCTKLQFCITPGQVVIKCDM